MLGDPCAKARCPFLQLNWRFVNCVAVTNKHIGRNRCLGLRVNRLPNEMSILVVPRFVAGYAASDGR